MIRFILTVPDRLTSAVLQQMLAWRAQTESDEGCTIRIVEKPGVVQNSAPSPVPEAAEAEIGAEETGTVPDMAAVPVVSAPVPADRSTKVYRIIDTAAHIGPIPQSIRVYLLDHPNSTCRQIITATGRGQKSVESSLYLLRMKGIVKESERSL